MKRKATKKKRKIPAQPKKKKVSPRAKTWIIIGSTIFGITAGCLFWYFISRCVHTHCLFHHWPVKEVLISGLFFAIVPFLFLNEDIG